MSTHPVILDFDGSVLPVSAHETRLPFSSLQEKIRFACSGSALQRLGNDLEQLLPSRKACIFMGSGDFHHVSLPLIKLAARTTQVPWDLIILDNHPDNMRFPFGVHCGSWVSRATALTAIRHTHVLGITSTDIGGTHAWENRLLPLLRGRLTYWSVNRPAVWFKTLGLADRHRNFPDADALLDAFLPLLAASPGVYLSIDKDVLSPEDARTNWDQGVFKKRHLRAVVEACRSKLAGTDVTGEISLYAYKNPFKRLLSRLDGQHNPEPGQTDSWQRGHQNLNREILNWINSGSS